LEQGSVSAGSDSAAPSGGEPSHRRRAVEQSLFRRCHREGDAAARDALVERFLPLTRQLARRYRRSSEPLEDLEQVASLGLVKAIDRYDPSRGTAFTSFLVPTVLGELKRHFRDSAWAAHVPRRMQERVMRVTTAVEDLSGLNGHSPSVPEIAAETQQSTEQVREAMEASHAYHARPLEGSRSDEDEEADHLSELGRQEPGYDLVEFGASLRPAIQSLPVREREILRLRFVEDLTQSEIASRVGISQMHVSRLIRAAVERLEEATDENAIAEQLSAA
jgi:RNA polymerase sigma-B factor